MRLRSLVFILIFSLLVSLPLIFFAPEREASQRERRMLTPLNFTYANTLDDKIDMIDGWFSDHIGLRDEMYKYLMGARFKVFGVIDYLDMLEGTAPNQWYMMDGYQEMDYTGADPYFPEYSITLFTQAIKNIGFRLSNDDIPFIVMINPDKMEVEGQYIPNIYIRNTNKFRSDRIAEILREDTDIPIILSKEYLINYDGRYDDKLIRLYDEAGYPIEDPASFSPHTFWESSDPTHWNYFGAFLAYEPLMAELEKTADIPVLSFDDMGFKIESIDDSFIWGIPQHDISPVWNIDDSNIEVDYNIPERIAGASSYRHYHNNDLEDEDTALVIVGDSYIHEYLINLLPQSYTDIYFIEYFESEDTLFNLVYETEPDAVIFEWASRMVPGMNRGMMSGWGV